MKSGVGGLGLTLRRPRNLRAALADVPADEVADHRGAVALANDRAKGGPQVVIDPDGAVSRVGVFHEVNGRRCIYRAAQRKVAVYIHTRYSRGYTRRDQVAWQIGVCSRETGGLFRMPEINLEAPVVRTLPGHVNCRHRYYGMSCDTYEAMLRESSQRCGICGCAPHGNTSGKLFIDHESKLGVWAVRGLLCHRCNSLIGDKLGWGVALPGGHRAYLSDPWYVRRARELGVTLNRPVEPSRSASVQDAHGRIWKHTWMGWRCADGRARSRDWKWLTAQFGPIGLTINND